MGSFAETVGITAFAGYVPRLRLSRQAIVDANIWRDPALRTRSAGERAICNWDEDAVTMAVEAARGAVASRSDGPATSLFFASTTAPFDDRQNSTIVAEALGLEGALATMDVAGSQRAGTTALAAAFDRVAARGGVALAVAAERRRPPAGSAQELIYGDGAAAVMVERGAGVARLVGSTSFAVDFVDHFRARGRDFDYHWEERWVRDEGYLKIVPPAVRAALCDVGWEPGTIAHFCMPSSMARVPQLVARAAGIADTAVRDQLHARCGDTGVAHPLILLLDALGSARPGDRIAVVGFGQGCDVLLFEATDAVVSAMDGSPSIGQRLAEGRSTMNYSKYLALSDLVRSEKGPRSEVDKLTPPSSLYRNRSALLGLTGGRCERCGTIQYPASVVCATPGCLARGPQTPVRLAESRGRVLSWSADQLTYTPDPPAHFGMIEFEEGGRMMADLTDIDAGEVEVGMPVRMMFRIKDIDELRGFRRYFWKAVPDRSAGAAAH